MRRALFAPVFVLSICGVLLTGEIVPGVTCPAIRTDDGREVALSYLPSAFGPGSRVTVRGSGYGASATCQREVLIVREVRAASPQAGRH